MNCSVVWGRGSAFLEGNRENECEKVLGTVSCALINSMKRGRRILCLGRHVAISHHSCCIYNCVFVWRHANRRQRSRILSSPHDYLNFFFAFFLDYQKKKLFLLSLKNYLTPNKCLRPGLQIMIVITLGLYSHHDTLNACFEIPAELLWSCIWKFLQQYRLLMKENSQKCMSKGMNLVTFETTHISISRDGQLLL